MNEMSGSLSGTHRHLNTETIYSMVCILSLIKYNVTIYSIN